MAKIQVNPGDIFFVQGTNFIADCINAVQKLWSKDHNSEYSHCGIIISRNGDTIEALEKVENKNIFKHYKKKKILIMRHSQMAINVFESVYPLIEKHKNDTYPYWRLALHLCPKIAEHVNITKKLVCSELAAKQFVLADLKKKYLGINVDMLHDWCIKNKYCFKVFEDKLINI